MYVGFICLPISLIAVVVMIVRIPQTCVLTFEYKHLRYQMNPLSIQYQNIYCILQSDAILLCFGFFRHFENPLTWLCTILQEHQIFVVKEK